MIGENLSLLDGENVIDVTVAEFASVLYDQRNRFIRVVWHSNQNGRLYKTGKGAAYKHCDVRKLYVATARNGFSFANRVKKILADRGESAAAVGWQPQARTWGGHVPRMPFVIHRNTSSDELQRLYSNFLVVRYYSLPGETGYYVDGVKANDKQLKSLEYPRKKPTTALAKARYDGHPVNARLDDVIAFRVGGNWYNVIPPTAPQIEQLATNAAAFGEQLVASA